MTERLYYTGNSAEDRTNLLSCSIEPSGRYVVVLDRALFHPQGDGQPANAGQIDDERVKTVLACSDDVVRIVAKPLLLGIVNLRVDATPHQLHARLHSARYLAGLAGTAFGWLPVEAHHQPNEGHITFTAGKNDTLPDTLPLWEKIDAWQIDNLSRQVTFTDRLRQVRFGHLLTYPCRGTYAAHLSEIGPVTIAQVKMKEGQVIVNYTLVPQNRTRENIYTD